MAGQRQEGWRERRDFEPAASGVTGRRSNQLSYTPGGGAEWAGAGSA